MIPTLKNFSHQGRTGLGHRERGEGSFGIEALEGIPYHLQGREGLGCELGWNRLSPPMVGLESLQEGAVGWSL